MEYFWREGTYIYIYKQTDTLPYGLKIIHLKLRKEDYFDIEILSDSKIRPTIKNKYNRHDIPPP